MCAYATSEECETVGAIASCLYADVGAGGCGGPTEYTSAGRTIALAPHTSGSTGIRGGYAKHSPTTGAIAPALHGYTDTG